MRSETSIKWQWTYFSNMSSSAESRNSWEVIWTLASWSRNIVQLPADSTRSSAISTIQCLAGKLLKMKRHSSCIRMGLANYWDHPKKTCATMTPLMATILEVFYIANDKKQEWTCQFSRKVITKVSTMQSLPFPFLGRSERALTTVPLELW